MNVVLKSIPHSQQRYETVGDWQELPNGDLLITVSDLGDWRYDSLVLVHELVEVLLCKQCGITTQMVDEFDMKFEAARKEGNEDEPGDDPKAPYYREHQFAMKVERELARELGVNWDEYEEKILSL